MSFEEQAQVKIGGDLSSKGETRVIVKSLTFADNDLSAQFFEWILQSL